MHPLTTDPERLGTTQLDDGRNLAWAEWGPPSGEAVLVCPSAATSRWLGFGAESAHDLGLRLISLDRPGLGASDPDPGRTLLTWADDIAQFTARRRLGEPTVVGYSQGFMGGSSGYARDTGLAMSQCAFAAEDITVPVDLWYGALDASPVHSPDHGATLAQRLPNARHHLRPDLGAALLWTSAREILSALRA